MVITIMRLLLMASTILVGEADSQLEHDEQGQTRVRVKATPIKFIVSRRRGGEEWAGGIDHYSCYSFIISGVSRILTRGCSIKIHSKPHPFFLGVPNLQLTVDTAEIIVHALWLTKH